MRILITAAIVLLGVLGVSAQDFAEEPIRAFSQKLAASDPSDTTLINLLVESELIQTDDLNKKAEILLVAGTYYVDGYQYESAVALLERCLELSDDMLISAEAFFQIGTSYMYRDIRLKSLKYFHKALAAFTEANHPLGMGKSLDRIADNHNYIGEHETARPFYNRCIDIFTSIGDTARLTNVLGNIGGMMSEEGINDSALVFYNRAIELDKLSNDVSNLSSHLSGLAIAFEEKGQFGKALMNYHRSHEVAYQDGDDEDKAFANQHLGLFYYRTGNYDSAKYYMDITYEYATKMNYAQLLINSMDVLHQVAYYQGEYKNAYDVFSRYTSLNDSLLSLENINQISSLRSEYELENKERENSILLDQAKLRDQVIKNQSRLNTTLALGAILMGLAVIGMLLLNRSRRRKNRKIKEDRDLIQKQAEQLQELSNFKSKFFANISHDIRTPLTLIKGFADLIKRNEKSLSNESVEFMGFIDENVSRLMRMTDEINTLIQLEENRYQLQYSQIDINRYFGALAEMFKTGKSNKKVAFEYTSEAEKGQMLHADKGAVEKIVFNIVGNALKYNTTGTKVNMAIAVVDADLEIKISDDGPGIEPEKLDKIFNRYYRTSSGKDAPKGQGIGLSLAMDLVKLHGGDLSVSSIQGKETCFKVSLPLNLDKPIEGSSDSK